MIHNHTYSCIQKFNSVPNRSDVLFIKRDANEKVHLCVLLIPIHQTAGRDVSAHASVSGLIMSPCPLFVSLSTAAKHSLMLGIMARRDTRCQAINIRNGFLGCSSNPAVHGVRDIQVLTKRNVDRDPAVTLHEFLVT